MITFPNAKINLGLNIVEKRPDGYHNLETIFYPINLQDALEVNRMENSQVPYKLRVSGTAIEGSPEENLVVKAYNLLREKYELAPVDIHLYKHIPMGAGLGGGSADGAFMIKVLNEKFRLGLSIEEMESYAAQLVCHRYRQRIRTYPPVTGQLPPGTGETEYLRIDQRSVCQHSAQTPGSIVERNRTATGRDLGYLHEE